MSNENDTPEDVGPTPVIPVDLTPLRDQPIEDWFRVGAYGLTLSQVISVAPEVGRGVCNIQLKGSGYINIPCEDPVAMAVRINDAKCALAGVRVVS